MERAQGRPEERLKKGKKKKIFEKNTREEVKERREVGRVEKEMGRNRGQCDGQYILYIIDPVFERILILYIFFLTVSHMARANIMPQSLSSRMKGGVKTGTNRTWKRFV